MQTQYSGIQGPLWRDSKPLSTFISHCTPGCMSLLHMCFCLLHFCHALSFPVFSLCCYICLNADACLSRSVEMGSCSTHLMYSQLITIFIFPWNPMCNQMSAVMSSFDALCSSCFSCCTYFTWLCSIPRKWLIKSFLYCMIKSSFKIWLIFIIYLLQCYTCDTCKRLRFLSWKQSEGL